MIEYKKVGVNENVIRLLKKLDIKYPLQSILTDIENKNVSVLEVYYDQKLYGILVVRGEFNRRGMLVLVINHVIAEDQNELHFSSILKESLREFAYSRSFKILRQESHNKVLSRMLRTEYGDPLLEVFEMELSDANTNRNKTPAFVDGLSNTR